MAAKECESSLPSTEMELEDQLQLSLMYEAYHQYTWNSVSR